MLNKIRQFILLGILCCSSCAQCGEHADCVYAEIEDICHPTLDDYMLIQEYLFYGFRPFIDRLNPWQYKSKAREFRLVGRNSSEVIESGVIPVNCEENDRENCILLYCSFNHEYPRCLKRLIDMIKSSDFKGHIVFHIGGWPDLEGGSLTFAHIPFAFKISSFREAERLGFKRALWLDASIVPLDSLNNTFKMISENGYFTFRTINHIKELCNEHACDALGVNFDEADQIPACLAGIIGFDFQNDAAQKALTRWYEVTKNHEEAYFSFYQELCVLSVILHQTGLSDIRKLEGIVTWEINEIDNPGIEFFVDKYAVQPNWPYN